MSGIYSFKDKQGMFTFIKEKAFPTKNNFEQHF